MFILLQLSVEFTQVHFIDLCETVQFGKASIFDLCALKDISPLCGQSLFEC